MTSTISRRMFLTRASTGAVALGALGSVPGLAAAAPAQTGVTEEPPEIALTEPFVVYIHDPSAGEVAIISGTQEVTRHDPVLVAHLLNLMG
jgi:hypothetical protein